MFFFQSSFAFATPQLSSQKQPMLLMIIREKKWWCEKLKNSGFRIAKIRMSDASVARNFSRRQILMVLKTKTTMTKTTYWIIRIVRSILQQVVRCHLLRHSIYMNERVLIKSCVRLRVCPTATKKPLPEAYATT